MRAAQSPGNRVEENREMTSEMEKLLKDAEEDKFVRGWRLKVGSGKHDQCSLPPGAWVTAVSSSTTVLRAPIAPTPTASSSTSVTAAVARRSVISAGTTPTASASSSSTTVAIAVAKRVLMNDGLEPTRDLLVCFTKKLDEVTDDVLVATVEEGGGTTGVTCTTSTTDAMNVVIDVGGKIIVDDMGNVGNIEATGGNGGGNHDRSATLAEVLEGHFTLPLGSVTVNGCSRVMVGDEVVAQYVGHPLGLDEDKSQATQRFHGKDVQEDRAFIVVFNVFDFLGDVFGGGANTADGEENVVLEEILG